MKIFLCRTTRLTAAVLFVFLLANQFAHAARLPRRLVAFQASAAAAQASSSTPAPILTGRTVFVSNSGAQTGFPYSADSAYHALAQSLEQWGRYRLVSSPAEADLIFNLRAGAPIGGVVVNDGTGGSYRTPELRLTIVDPHTQVPLWTLTTNVYTGRKKDKADWLAVAAANLTSQVKLLTGDPLSTQESLELSQVPKGASHAWLLFVLVAPIALFLTAFFVERHEANKSATEHGLTCATNPFFCTN